MEENKKNTSEAEENKGRENEVEEYEEDEDEDLFVEEDEEYNEEGNAWENAKEWFQDNLRVILSVIIVVLIAVGIYNYSSKPAEEEQSRIDALIGEKEVALEEETVPTEEINVKEKESADSQVVVKEEGKEGEVKVEDKKAEEPKVEEKKTEKPVETPKPTEESKPVAKPEAKIEKNIEGLHVSAAKGDGLTHLARKAVQEYLAQNPDASITKEHKIYLEDYLRKNVASGRIKEGDVRVFSEQLITDAMTKAKNLTPAQLENLKRYSARVSNL